MTTNMTTDTLTDLAARLTQAIETTQVLAGALVSYVQEAQRAEVSDPRDEQWQRALDMYGADAKHFGDCDQGGCNACILNDVHRIIRGVSRPGVED